MQDQANIARDLARRDIYAFISLATTDPAKRERRLDDVATQSILNCAIEMIREDERFHPSSLGPGEISPADLKLRLPSDLEAMIDAEYVPVFGYCASKDCPPYETEYCSVKEINFRTQQMADVAGFYEAFGLRRASKTHERIDHVALETEFMSILITRQLHAIDEHLPAEGAQICVDAQHKFFKDHLGWWLPAFGYKLMNRGSGFFMVLGKLICAFVPAERAILGLPAGAQMASAQTHSPEEMMCQGCDAALLADFPGYGNSRKTD